MSLMKKLFISGNVQLFCNEEQTMKFAPEQIKKTPNETDVYSSFTCVALLYSILSF